MPLLFKISSKPGSLAMVFGTNLVGVRSKATVYVGTKKAKVRQAKATSIKFTIPRLPKGAYNLYVVVDGKESNRVLFTIKGYRNIS